VRSKKKQVNLPVLDALEFRETVSDTFFVALPLAGVGLFAAAGERSSDTNVGAGGLDGSAVEPNVLAGARAPRPAAPIGRRGGRPDD
jgi:hypothetical protein